MHYIIKFIKIRMQRPGFSVALMLLSFFAMDPLRKKERAGDTRSGDARSGGPGSLDLLIGGIYMCLRTSTSSPSLPPFPAGVGITSTHSVMSNSTAPLLPGNSCGM